MSNPDMPYLSDIKSDYEAILSASDYNAYHLKWGNSADSSGRAKARMEYISQALKLPDVKQLVLKRAAELAKAELEVFKEIYIQELEDLDEV